MNHTQYGIYRVLHWIDIEKINWNCICLKPNAIHLLQQNLTKLIGIIYLANQILFTYNYSELKRRMKETIAEDLMKNRFHPKHMDKWLGWGQVEEEDFA
jgi:preprotein translocase subunit SecY